MQNKELYEKWSERISKAEKAYQNYHDLIKEIREYYKGEKKNRKDNIFWSSIETLKPFLYFKTPEPYVERKERITSPIESVACKILQNALKWDLEQFDFDSVIKYMRNDYLLSGLGLVYEKYCPTFKKVSAGVMTPDIMEVQEITIKDSEVVETQYIDPEKLIADSEKVGIWEDCTWVARKIEMTKREVMEQFDKRNEDLEGEEDSDEKNTVVYEIWDKATRKILYYSKDFKDEMLKVVDDVLSLKGFFPFPRPIMTSCTNNSIIPVPDYTQVKPLMDELDGLTQRSRLIVKALKVTGCYDSSFSRLADILERDVSLVPLPDFEKLKEAGGIAGAIDFMPISQYIEALQALSTRRAEVIQAIYEITGVSDVMRGNSDPYETATAVNKKTNFGTLRNQDRQNDMQRFLTELLQIKAEIICEQFSPETLIQFAKDDDPQIVMKAIALLKEEKLRGMVLGIETDSTFNQEDESMKLVESIRLISDMIKNAFGVVTEQPLLLPLYRQMTGSLIATMPNARQFEKTIDDVFTKIQQQLSQPKEPQPIPEMVKIEKDYEIKKEQNQLKAEELELKKQAEINKTTLAHKEMDAQIALKNKELDIEGRTNENITTGYAGSLYV